MKFYSCLLVTLVVAGAAFALPAQNSPKLHQLASANDDFGLKLLQSLESVEHSKAAQSRKNVFISSFSVGTVLAMMLAGGANETYSQIYNTLGFTNSHFSNSDIFQSYNQLFNAMVHNPNGKENVLRIANAIAVQKNFALLESFMSTITNDFSSRVFAEDFVKEGHKATKEINEWVNTQTHGKIPKLFDEDLSRDTILVLLNAIYFKGTWKTKFDKAHTNKAQFHIANDHHEEVQMMNVKSTFNYGHFEDGQLLELPYQNETMSMYIYLPSTASNTKTIATAFSAQTLEQKIGQLFRSTVSVHIPKFKVEATYELTKTLAQLGIRDAFLPDVADFSNMDGRKKDRVLYLSDVIHKTYVEVNEEGSEAAAVTGGHIRHHLPMPPHPDPVFRADRPFAFFIRDKQHGVTLFSGVINKP